MHPPHPFGNSLTGPQPNPGLGKRAVKAEIDFRNARRSGKTPLIFFAIAA